MLKPLSIKALPEMYERLLATFAENEVKPYEWIERLIQKGQYQLYGYYEGEELLAVAMMMNDENPGLLDYYCIHKDHRAKGLGSLLIRDLSQMEKFIVELEDPDSASSEKERQQRQRRLKFYERNGFIDLALRATIFGTTYRLYHSPTLEPLADIKETYRQIYKKMVPDEKTYQENVIIH